jgi:hypothetical protein
LVESVCRWNYNIKMYPREMGLEGVDWILLVQYRDHGQALVNTVNDYNWNSHCNCMNPLCIWTVINIQ